MRMRPLFWIPCKVTGLVTGGLLLLLSCVAGLGESRLWGDPILAWAPNSLQLCLAFFLFRWGAFPYPFVRGRRIEGILACSMASALNVCVAGGMIWTGHSRYALVFMALTASSLASWPSLMGKPLLYPRKPGRSDALLGIASLTFLLLSALQWAALSRRVKTFPSEPPSQVLIWLGQEDVGTILAERIEPAPEGFGFVAPFSQDQMAHDALALQATVKLSQSGYAVLGLLDMGAPLRASTAQDFVSLWEAFETSQDTLLSYERTAQVGASFVDPSTPGPWEDAFSLAAKSKQDYHRGRQDVGMENVSHFVRQVIASDRLAVAFAPACAIEDLADPDPGIQTCLDVAVIPPWEWSQIYLWVPPPPSPRSEGGEASFHATLYTTARSLSNAMDSKAGILIGPLTHDKTMDLKDVARDIQIAVAAGVRQVAVYDYAGLRAMGGPGAIKSLAEALKERQTIQISMTPDVLLRRHLLYLSDLLLYP